MAADRRAGSAFAQVSIESRGELRRWLETNQRRAESVWIVVWKKGDPRHVPYTDIVDEVLCFGWVDSLPRKFDAARSMLLISPRRASSAWSAVNKKRVERLTVEGRMAPAGLACVAAAQASGTWRKLDAVEELHVPDDLAAAFGAFPDARRHWDAFPPSARRGILEWIVQAKRPATRAARVAETASEAAVNRRAHQWRGKPAKGTR